MHAEKRRVYGVPFLHSTRAVDVSLLPSSNLEEHEGGSLVTLRDEL